MVTGEMDPTVLLTAYADAAGRTVAPTTVAPQVVMDLMTDDRVMVMSGPQDGWLGGLGGCRMVVAVRQPSEDPVLLSVVWGDVPGLYCDRDSVEICAYQYGRNWQSKGWVRTVDNALDYYLAAVTEGTVR